MRSTDQKNNLQLPEKQSLDRDYLCSEPCGCSLKDATEVLERVVADRGILLQLSKEDQERFLRAVGQIAHPGRAAKKQLVRAHRQRRKDDRQQAQAKDDQVLRQAGIRNSRIRRLAAAQPQPGDEHVVAPEMQQDGHHFIGELEQPRNCYVCKQDFKRLHFFYDSLCPNCAEFNWSKRNQTADLKGRYALLTGGRVKIGFEAALKLLRAGASVLVTTRFPKDAANRFASVTDACDWLDRLQVYGLDLRHTPSVEAFADYLLETLPRLDFILNNACQTVRRPTGYYQHMMSDERRPSSELSDAQRLILKSYEDLVRNGCLPNAEQKISVHSAGSTLLCKPNEQLAAVDLQTPRGSGIRLAAELSQVALLEEDSKCGEKVFPQESFDEHHQQVDLREKNSWRLKLAEISTVEMVEVQLINAIAPFVLNSKLKPLMTKVPSSDKHIVNVSAMEGVFYRAFKRDTHPHTNMAKAALNMMTRTSAIDYLRDGIHINSVDTGWITDEDPIEITKRKQADHRFSTPLDTIDAAARICDPIFDGLNTGQHQWGKFLKDYRVSNW